MRNIDRHVSSSGSLNQPSLTEACGTPYNELGETEDERLVSQLSAWEQLKAVSSVRLCAVFPFYCFAIAAPTLLVTQLGPLQESYYGSHAFEVKASYISGYSILGFISSAFVGRASDTLGRQKMLILCGCLLSLPYLGLSLSGDVRGSGLDWYAGLYAISGLGTGWQAVVSAYVADCVPREELRRPAFGLLGFAQFVGLAIGGGLGTFNLTPEELSLLCLVLILITVLNACTFPFLVRCCSHDGSTTTVRDCEGDSSSTDAHTGTCTGRSTGYGAEQAEGGLGCNWATFLNIACYQPFRAIGACRRQPDLFSLTLVLFLTTWAQDGLIDALSLYLVARGFYHKKVPAPLVMLLGVMFFLGPVFFMPYFVKALGSRLSLVLSCTWLFGLCVLITFAFSQYHWYPYFVAAVSGPALYIKFLCLAMTSELIVPEEQGYVMGALNSVMQLSGVLGALLPLALAGAYASCGDASLRETSDSTCNSTVFGIPWLFAAGSCLAAATITYKMPKNEDSGRIESLSLSGHTSMSSATSRRFGTGTDEFSFGSSN